MDDPRSIAGRRIVMRAASAAAAIFISGAYAAEPAIATSGAAIVVPAVGEVSRANDEARAILSVEFQEADRAAAVAKVNRAMNEGLEILRREDPGAKLETRGYSTHPVYDDGGPRPAASPREPRIVAWRAGQSVELVTTRIAELSRTVAAAQSVLSLTGIDFTLSREARRALDRDAIETAWRRLEERVGFVLAAMGRRPADAVVEKVDFEGEGTPPPRPRMALAMEASSPRLPEPSFEPGETTIQTRVVGHVKLR